MSFLRLAALGWLCVLVVSDAAVAQTNLQAWANVSLNWVRSDKLGAALDLEPQTLVVSSDDQPGWAAFGATPNVEFAPRGWLDLIGELPVTVTRQTDGLDSVEVAPRGGARFHLFSRDVVNRIDRHIPGAGPVRTSERPPKRRLVLRDRLLIEQRNFFYNGTEPNTSAWRLRNRVELQFPLNRARATDAGARTLVWDYEVFVPVGDPSERFANRHRVRAGLAFRQSFEWRSEVIYAWTRSRDTIDRPFSTTDNIISMTVKRYFK